MIISVSKTATVCNIFLRIMAQPGRCLIAVCIIPCPCLSCPTYLRSSRRPIQRINQIQSVHIPVPYIRCNSRDLPYLHR